VTYKSGVGVRGSTGNRKTVNGWGRRYGEGIGKNIGSVAWYFRAIKEREICTSIDGST
jgi:hypothetical protein